MADESLPTTVRDLIDRAAGENPGGIFLIDPASDETITFGDLPARVRAVIARVQDDEVPPGATVGVAMENGAAAAVTHLGLMYGGYVTVPINLTALEQVTYVSGHAELRLILATPAGAAAVAGAFGDVPHPGIASVGGDGLQTQADISTSLGDVRAGDDAMLIYTSGTTAAPKGVVVSHAAMAARGRNDARSQEIRTADRLLCVLPLHHMNAIGSLLGALYSRSSIVLPRRFAVAELWDLAIRYRCTHLRVVPTILSQLLAWPHVDRAALAAIRHVRCSSMRLAPDLQRAFEERFGLLVIEGMGMTEAGTIFLNPPSRELRKIGSLGVAAGLDARIVGPDGGELPNGEVGEIVVRGAALMTHYHRDPEATRRVIDEEGWLHTGDLGSRDDDGYFFHRGRIKEIIIKAGINVSPLAIEEALLSHPKIAEAAAVGIPDSSLGEDIAAFVVLENGTTLGQENLVEYCVDRLGVFRSPSTVLVVDSLPRGATGKIQRHELAERLPMRVARLHGSASATNAASSSDVEETIATIWSEALKCERIGRDVNFFAVGGSSMLALQVLVRVGERLGTHLPLSAFLEAPTIAGQAARIEEERLRRTYAALDDEPKAILLAPVSSRGTATPLFCAYGLVGHRRLAERLGPTQPVYGLVVDREVDAFRGAVATVSVEELARRYLIAVRRVQPSGPYQLAGFSFGGRVALEMAQQLVAAGETVALVAPIDTFLDGGLRRRPLRWLAVHLAKTFELGPGYAIEMARRRWMGAAATTDEVLRARGREVAFRQRARARHRLRPYGGKILLLRARDNDFPAHYRLDPLLGWKRVAGGELVVESVPGRHVDLLQPPAVDELAARLRPHLIGARSAGR